MNGVKRFRGRCPCCGEPVLGAADLHTGATVPQPGRGEVPLCLSCLLFPGAASDEQVAGAALVDGDWAFDVQAPDLRDAIQKVLAECERIGS